jgi:transposase
MDRLQQIADEFIRLYRQQLSMWIFAKMHDLSLADLFQYERRKIRLRNLRRELEKIVSAEQECPRIAA